MHHNKYNLVQIQDIPGYATFRNDRNSSGGAIIYVSQEYIVREVDKPTAPLSMYDTEIFLFTLLNCVYYNRMVVAIYHLVWNNLTKHEGAISCVLEVLDNVLSSFSKVSSSFQSYLM